MTGIHSRLHLTAEVQYQTVLTLPFLIGNFVETKDFAVNLKGPSHPNRCLGCGFACEAVAL